MTKIFVPWLLGWMENQRAGGHSHGSGNMREQQVMAISYMNVSHLYCIFNAVNLITALRIEWCKARARAQRWSEEVRLLLEEMRRILEFLNWRATFWETRAGFLQCDLAAAEHTTNELLGNPSLLSARIEGTQVYAPPSEYPAGSPFVLQDALA
jgi:hypothetical protein